MQKHANVIMFEEKIFCLYLSVTEKLFMLEIKKIGNLFPQKCHNNLLHMLCKKIWKKFWATFLSNHKRLTIFATFDKCIKE